MFRIDFHIFVFTFHFVVAFAVAVVVVVVLIVVVVVVGPVSFLPNNLVSFTHAHMWFAFDEKPR